jgi:hypothetical protein
MEALGKPNENDESNNSWKLVFQTFSLIILCGFSYLSLGAFNHEIKYIIFLFSLSIFCSITIAHYSWLCGDLIRKWIMPEVFVTHGAVDALKKKIFWSLGPQSFVAFWATCITFMFGFVYMENIYTGQSFNLSNFLGETPTHVIEKDNPTSIDTVQKDIPVKLNASEQIQADPINKAPTENVINEVKPTLEELEAKAGYNGDDPVIRKRLGLPPKE